MKQIKYEEDCRIPFNLSCLYRRNNIKGAELRLKDGSIIQVPIPSDVRYASASYIRWLKPDEGQETIEEYTKNKIYRLW